MTNFSLKSYLKFLGRNKLFTVINILGFAISLTFVLLLGLYTEDESNINKQHTKKDRIYRLRNEQFSNFSAPVPGYLTDRFPEIEATMLINTRNMGVNDGVREQTLETVMFVDSTLLTMFDFPMIEGNRSTALSVDGNALLTKSYATKLFGSESAVGKTIKINNDHQYIVSGVIADLEKTHIKNPSVIIKFTNIRYFDGNDILQQLGRCNFDLYLLMRPGNPLTDEKLVEMREYMRTFFWVYQGDYAKELIAEPLTKVYFSEMRGGSNYLLRNETKFLRILSFIALAVLLFAVINYINLSVAQSGFRAKESAVRRLLGGSRMGLFSGFILESFLMCFASFIVAVALAELFSGPFNSLMRGTVDVKNLLSPPTMAILLGLIIGVSLVSGMIPAYTLSRFKPIDVVRGTFKRKTKMMYSKFLITFQYMITIILLGCAITIGKQLNYMLYSDKGYNHENVLMTSCAVPPAQYETLRGELSSIPGVENIGFGQGSPTTDSNNYTFTLRGTQYSFQTIAVDSSYFNILGFNILSETGVKDQNGVWLNQTAAKQLGLAPDATEFEFGSDGRFIKLRGIVRDFNTSSFEQAIKPVMIETLQPGAYAWDMAIKITGNEPFAVADHVIEHYKKIAGTGAIVAEFIDKHLQDRYSEHIKTSKIISLLSLVAIIIATMGIVAMSIYFIRQRTQEVAVRKVFGSSNSSIFSILTSTFAKLMLLAFVLSIPAIWYLSDMWLQTFVYKIDITWDIFVMAGLATLLITYTAISWQAYRAMIANPVKSLKSE